MSVSHAMREGSGSMPAKFDRYSDVSLRITRETFLGLILFLNLLLIYVAHLPLQHNPKVS